MISVTLYEHNSFTSSKSREITETFVEIEDFFLNLKWLNLPELLDYGSASNIFANHFICKHILY